MPIDYKKYGKEFIRLSKIARSIGYCAYCGVGNGKTNPRTGSKVVLTTHHIDQDISNNDPGNLIALCQQCHFSANRGQKPPYYNPMIHFIWLVNFQQGLHFQAIKHLLKPGGVGPEPHLFTDHTDLHKLKDKGER